MSPDIGHYQVYLLLFLTIFIFVIIYYLLRTIMALQKKKSAEQNAQTTQVGMVINTFHDLVGKLKEKEKELEALKKIAEDRASSVEIYNEHIFQSVPSGLVSFDRDLAVTKINAAARAILELGSKPAEGRSCRDLFESPILELIEQRQALSRDEVPYRTRSGKRIWIGLSISPLKDDAGKDIGRLLVFTDLTELKAFQSQMELRERLSSLGEMSAGIAHELRNPMAVISGYTKLLMKKSDEASRPAIEAIGREIEVMDRIITDFLSFAKPALPVLGDVPLHKVIRSSLESVHVPERTRIVVGGATPVIRADEVLLRQALNNLFQNACDAMPEGGTLDVQVSTGQEIAIRIADSGHGIPESIRAKIYLPFFTTKERGTGLGLSIVHQIITSHNGTLSLGDGHEGTVFVITFPMAMLVSG